MAFDLSTAQPETSGFDLSTASAEGGPRPRQPGTFRGSVESALSSFINSLAFGIPEAIDRATRPERAAVYEQRAEEYPQAQSMGQISGEVLPLAASGAYGLARLGQMATNKLSQRMINRETQAATQRNLAAQAAERRFATEQAEAAAKTAETRAARTGSGSAATEQAEREAEKKLRALAQLRQQQQSPEFLRQQTEQARREAQRVVNENMSRYPIPKAVGKKILPSAGGVMGAQIGAGTAGATYGDEPGRAYLYSDMLGEGIRGTTAFIPGVGYVVDPLTRIVPGIIGLGTGLGGLYDR